VGEAVADGVGGHRLQPQTADRLVGLGVLDDVAEDQFALAARVTGIDQAGNVLALDQPRQHLQAVGSLLDRIQREVRRNHRQVGEGPFAALDIVFLGHRELEQVADG
jgi:hypothetical protein